MTNNNNGGGTAKRAVATEQSTALVDNGHDAINDVALDAYIRADAIVKAINANLPQGARQLEPIPQSYVLRRKDKEAASVALHAAFELRGGVPALLAWAHDNPDSFYTLWGKLIHSDTSTPVAPTTINFVTSVPKSALDSVTVDEAGNVTDVEFDDELPQ